MSTLLERVTWTDADVVRGKALKYSDDQPRDDHGRWTDSGSSANETGGSGHVDFASFAHRLSEPDGGFTVNTITGSEPHGPGHYIVSIYPHASQPVEPSGLKAADLSQYVLAHQDLLSRPGHYFGGWHDPAPGGKIWLDTSVVVKDRAQAERLAKAHNQISYFDLGAGKSVNVGGTGEDHGKATTESARRVGAEGQAVLRAGDSAAAQSADGAGRDAGRYRTSRSGRRPLLPDGHDWRIDARAWAATLKADRRILAQAGDDDALALADTPTFNDRWPHAVKRAAQQEPVLARALVRAWTDARAALNLDAVARALRKDDLNGVLAAIRAADVNTRTSNAAKPLIQNAFINGVQAGKPALRRLGVQVRGVRKDDGDPSAIGDLSGYNVQAVLWADEHAADLMIAEDDQKEIIRLLVAEAETGAATVDELAEAVKAVVGLTPQAAQAVVNYATSLWDQDLPSDDVLSQVEDYALAKLDQRAMTIARTETMAATNGGQMALWTDAQSQGLIGDNMRKEWIVTDDGRLCDDCAALGDSDPVPIDEPFDGDVMQPPEHPNCRCTIGLVRADDGE